MSSMGLEEHIGELLKSCKLTIAVAESCTGGLIGALLTSVAGSSAYFRGGVIAYDNDVKRDVLGVKQNVLESYGAVSAPVAEAMAQGVALLFKCDCSVSVSGIAGPDGGTVDKPVGLVYIGTCLHSNVQSRRFLFAGSRDEIRLQSARAAIEFMAEMISCQG